LQQSDAKDCANIAQDWGADTSPLRLLPLGNSSRNTLLEIGFEAAVIPDLWSILAQR
jgi:hypothetical protein